MMIQDLTAAKTRSIDQPDQPPVQAVSERHTGRPGRPRKEIHPEVLAAGLQYGGPTELGRALNVAPRTVRRRALEAGLVEPGPPVYVEYVDETGNSTRVFTSSTGEQSNLSDEALDDIMLELLNTFPTFGRRMIDGFFTHQGHHVPRSRLQASYARVNGPSVAAFGVRRIHRRVYSVKGYNSLWHHDGQHGKSLFL